ncbi:MAG TPA: hypothetical protein VEG64_04875 [Candidatus Sulfotelmatobacter sp.]|nr:hypothetical protein [Candidatus Sulfotelmatobacter sp.]
MLILINKAAILLVCLTLILPIPTEATTVVIFVSPDGMIVASDRKTLDLAIGQKTLSPEITKKIVIIHDRIAVVSIGLSGDTRNANFTFPAWVENLNDGLPSDISVDAVVEAIKAKASQNLALVELKDLQSKKISTLDSCDMLTQFVVLGYDGSLPRVVVIQFNVDWDSMKIIAPKIEIDEPPSKVSSNFRVYSFGKQEALTNVSNRDSYAYKKANAACPKTIGKLLDHQVLTLSESGWLATALVQIEEDVDPSSVGSGVQVVRILPSGRAESSFQERGLREATCGDEKEPQKQEGRKP